MSIGMKQVRSADLTINKAVDPVGLSHLLQRSNPCLLSLVLIPLYRSIQSNSSWIVTSITMVVVVAGCMMPTTIPLRMALH